MNNQNTPFWCVFLLFDCGLSKYFSLISIKWKKFRPSRDFSRQERQKSVHIDECVFFTQWAPLKIYFSIFFSKKEKKITLKCDFKKWSRQKYKQGEKAKAWLA